MPAGRNHHPPASISIISKSRLPFARYNPAIRNIALVACSVGAEIWSREIATGKNAKTARSLDRAITRLVPPDCLVSPVSERAFLTTRQGREGEREKKPAISGMRMRTRKGGGRGGVFLISRSLSSRYLTDQRVARTPLELRRKVRSALIIVNQTSGRRSGRAGQGGPELRKHNYC